MEFVAGREERERGGQGDREIEEVGKERRETRAAGGGEVWVLLGEAGFWL